MKHVKKFNESFLESNYKNDQLSDFLERLDEIKSKEELQELYDDVMQFLSENEGIQELPEYQDFKKAWNENQNKSGIWLEAN
jgi:hypothetical protein